MSSTSVSAEVKRTWWQNPLKLMRSTSTESEPSSPAYNKVHMTPEMAAVLAKRRESLEKLKVEKPAPWMLLHPFESDEEGQ